MQINKETSIEELMNILPESVSYMMRKGIKCIACGEPVWGTIGDACIQKGFSKAEITEVIEELNLILYNKK